MTRELAKYLYELWLTAHGYGTDDPELEKKNRDKFHKDLTKRLDVWQAWRIESLLD